MVLPIEIVEKSSAGIVVQLLTGSIPLQREVRSMSEELGVVGLLKCKPPDSHRGDMVAEQRKASHSHESSGRGVQQVGTNTHVRGGSAQSGRVVHEHEGGGMSEADCARRIVEVVARFGLRPVEAPHAPEPITEDDLGVVCYQVVLPG